MKMVRMILGGVLLVGAVGYGWYARKHAAEIGGANTKTEMIQACGADSACVGAVNNFMDTCIRETGAAHPDVPIASIRAYLVECINQKAGGRVFEIEH